MGAGLLALVGVGWYLGRARTLEAAGLAEKSRFGGFWLFWIRYVVPIGVILALISGWIDR